MAAEDGRSADPVSYAADGKQYMAVASGGNSLLGLPPGGRGGFRTGGLMACAIGRFFAGCHGVQRTRDLTKYERGE